MKAQIYRGIFLLMLAELFFAGATVFVKFACTNTNIPAIEVTFSRFLLGFIVSGIVMYKTKNSFKPNKTKLVIWRAVLNTAALIFFFLSVKLTTITNSNMLNMTYPMFIFLFTPFITKEKISILHGLYLFITMTGIYLIIHPDFSHINMGDWYGLLSGIFAALAVMTLRMAREFDSTILILFYLMAIGMVINGILLIPLFVLPNQKEFIYIIISAVLGYTGQVCITAGYKYIEAAKGSLISSSRILFAVVLGIAVFSESLTFKWIIGGMLIIISLIGISWPTIKTTKQQTGI